jgi:signal transduction histidine kinase
MNELRSKEIAHFVHTISELASKASGLRELLRESLKPICSAMGAQAGSIFLVNAVEKTLYLAATTNVRENHSEYSTIYRFGEGLTGYVAGLGEPLFIRNLADNPHIQGKYLEAVDFQPGSFFVAPMLWYSGRILGVVRCVSNKVLSQAAAHKKIQLLQIITSILSPYVAATTAENEQTMSIERITHELKSSLVAIKSTMQMLIHTEKCLSDVSRDRVHDMNILCDMLMTSVESKSLAFGKSLIVRGKRTLFYRDILMPALTMLKPRMVSRNLSLQISDNVNNSPSLNVDRHLILLAVYNLLDNAIKYSASGTSIQVDAGHDSKECWFSFGNTGTTISRNDRDLIFSPGYRSAEAQRRNVSGQGLGLYIVRRIMEGHEGKVELDSDSQLITFRLTFPLGFQEEVKG